MLFLEFLKSDSVKKQFLELNEKNTFKNDREEIPFRGYELMSPPTFGILQSLSELKMPSFPVARVAEESEDDSKTETDVEIDSATEPKVKAIRPQVVLERIALSEYKKNEQAIKDGLRSSDAMIFTKFPGGKPIAAERFSAPTPFHVFTIPSFTGAVDFVYRQEDFPASFIGFQDKAGERWKCVAVWDGTKIIYMANIAAEIRLCSLLYTGSSNGKVRWEKAVEPRNNIASNFASFAVSDRVLLERRKQHWPEALKKLRESCQGTLAVAGPAEQIESPAATIAEKPKKVRKQKRIEDIVSGSSEDVTEKSLAPAPKKRKVAETYFQVTIGGKNRLSYTVAAGDPIQIDEMSSVSGKKVARNLFTL